ncbi:MAG: aminoacetone oxidase family FAD-binding enzyme [Ruminococcus sp.]|nr:aminoacetone oxidase family FAD-binding enzyme [Ruminococcus sp.]
MYDLIIIGGGAAGLAAAVTAAAYGIGKIAILEKLSRTGKKILATGNGRCNLSHTPLSADDYCGSVPVAEILSEFGDAADFFASLGLHCRTDSAGRIYPYSMHAASVLDALRQRAAQCGVQEICDAAVISLTPHKGGWLVGTASETYRAADVIFACGGHAAPHLGTDGSAWTLLEKLNIPLKSPRPVLCPLLSDPKILRPLKGLRVRANAMLMAGERCLYTENGEVQFTEKTVSGICIFNMASLVRTKKTQEYRVILDLLPEQDAEATLAQLYSFQASRSEGDAEMLLSGFFQKPLARLILKCCHVTADTPVYRLGDRKLREIAAMMHHLPFPITGMADWKQAQATAGGVSGAALDADLQVKAQPHLYIVGEAADVHSLCGGYHLHWAWASGAHAARSIAERSTRT